MKAARVTLNILKSLGLVLAFVGAFVLFCSVIIFVLWLLGQFFGLSAFFVLAFLIAIGLATTSVYKARYGVKKERSWEEQY